MTVLLKKVIAKELEDGVELPDKLINEITFSAHGSCRKALKMLDMVLDIPNDDDAIEAIRDISIGETTTLEICKMLLGENPKKWKELRDMIKTVDSEPENLRYSVLGYLSSVLLNNPTGDDRIARMIGIFTESVMYSGKGGIVLQLYLASKL